ncbi:unnamed protein product [Calypogeia fissa]
MQEMKMFDEVKEGLNKYISFFDHVGKLGKMKGAVDWEHWETLSFYWKGILDILKTKGIQHRQGDCEHLVHEFWSTSQWKDNVPKGYRNVACKLESTQPYCGLLKDKPRQAYNPRSDICIGQFVLVRPHEIDMDTYPIHMGQVVTEVEEGLINEDGKVEHVCSIEWWRPFLPQIRGTKGIGRKECFKDCWDKRWERCLEFPDTESISVKSVLFSFKATPTKNGGLVRTAEKNVEKAQDNLARCLEKDNSDDILLGRE